MDVDEARQNRSPFQINRLRVVDLPRIANPGKLPVRDFECANEFLLAAPGEDFSVNERLLFFRRHLVRFAFELAWGRLTLARQEFLAKPGET